MIGLLLKDFYNLKGLAKQMLLMLAVMAAWCVFMKNASFFSMITAMYGALMLLNSMSYDETAHFDKYVLTLPVTKRDVVREKYLLLFCLLGAGLVVGLAGNFGIRFFIKSEESVMEDLIPIAAITCFFLLAFSIMLPIMIKIGVEKARMLLVAVYVALFGMVAGVVCITRELGIELTEELAIRSLAVCAVIMVLGVIGSYLVSMGVIQKKEW